MNGMVLAYLAGSTAVFVAANATLKAYASGGGIWVLVLALLMFSVGNTLMVWVMRENGLGQAFALSAIFQLIAVLAVSFLWYGERPGGVHLAGLVLGVVAVTMIVWPQGGGA